jgi:hypothetical protein
MDWRFYGNVTSCFMFRHGSEHLQLMNLMSARKEG